MQDPYSVSRFHFLSKGEGEHDIKFTINKRTDVSLSSLEKKSYHRVIRYSLATLLEREGYNKRLFYLIHITIIEFLIEYLIKQTTFFFFKMK